MNCKTISNMPKNKAPAKLRAKSLYYTFGLMRFFMVMMDKREVERDRKRAGSVLSTRKPFLNYSQSTNMPFNLCSARGRHFDTFIAQ